MKFPETDKRIYRDVHNGMISGVCAGISKYVGVDVKLVRVAAVAVALFFKVPALLAYIVASFLLPKR